MYYAPWSVRSQEMRWFDYSLFDNSINNYRHFDQVAKSFDQSGVSIFEILNDD